MAQTTRLLSNDEFRQALIDAREKSHNGAHPFSKLWAEGKLTRKQLGQWAIQHHYYISPVPQHMAALFARLPDLDARQMLLENLLGEENLEDPSKRHPELCVKFAEACGVDRDDVVNAELKGTILPSTRAMAAWTWEVTTIPCRHISEAFAAISIALEGQLPTLYPKYVAAMEKMGFSDDDLEFFHVHIEGDDEHADVGMQLVLRYADTPLLQQRAIACVGATAKMRWTMMDGIYNHIINGKELYDVVAA